MIKVIPLNETYIKLHIPDYGIEQEVSEFFTFFAANYKFMPSYKSGQFDGRIRLYNMRTKQLYKGLVPVLKKFGESRGYEVLVDKNTEIETTPTTKEEVQEFIKTLNLAEYHTPRDYQIGAIQHALSNPRCILESATSSGKSLMIYCMIRHNLLKKHRTLLIVPNINLVKQMYSDFGEYGETDNWKVEDHVQMLYDKQSREFSCPVIISTWQTLLSMVKSDTEKMQELVDSVDMIIGDEAHQFKSTEVSGIMDRFVNTKSRLGTTGTLDSIQLNLLTLTGIFGTPKVIITTKELIDQGYATPIEVRIVVLKHPEEMRKALKGMDHDEEMKHICANGARNQFIANLAKSCKGNTLILYEFVQKHGDLIHEKLLATIPPNRKVHYIHGGIDADVRESIRKIVEVEEDSIILATSSLMSTGTNMPSIENMILAMPRKSATRLRQSAGRTIRKKEGKLKAKLFDIADDYRYKKWTNTAMKHLDERIKIYSQQEFPMKVINVDFKY
jgi:superfamily II DNA or RNA helicase